MTETSDRGITALQFIIRTLFFCQWGLCKLQNNWNGHAYDAEIKLDSFKDPSVINLAGLARAVSTYLADTLPAMRDPYKYKALDL